MILSQEEFFTHCYGHALNLAANDTLKQSKLMKDVLDTSREITNLIKYSPRREWIFMKLKEGLPASSTGIRVLCPTRWTVRADMLSSIISNYEALQNTWEEALAITKDTEAKARVQGVSAQMDMFQYLYGIMLSEMRLRHADNLSRTLQHKSLSAEEGQQVAQMTVDTITSLRNDDAFDLMWEKVSRKARSLNVSDPQLPRRRKMRRRLCEGSCEGDFHETPKEHYRQCYYEALDLIINCIQSRFDQRGYTIYHSLETLLIKAAKQQELEDDLKTVCAFYKDDFDQEMLYAQLQTFGVHFQQTYQLQSKEASTKMTIFDIKSYFLSLSHGQKVHLSQVKRLFQLVLVMPATNASSERSFSALRRLKSYHRTTMMQERLTISLCSQEQDRCTGPESNSK
ncbi:uncharacterized protein LOC134181294 [Corticium candelabrum]|uniref:uncharacterized protein LOC134181294 n=1 Tax=Corticium candelabrum TaxID=121492 RepID=UPI002E2679AA|nr:uncharacterized protein LOC134181294 [Corticium candelabrum]